MTIKKYREKFLKLKNAFKNRRIQTAEFWDDLGLLIHELNQLYVEIKNSNNSDQLNEIESLLNMINAERFELMPKKDYLF